MKSKQKQIVLLVFFIVLLFIINYSFLDKSLENFLTDYKFSNVKRVIDGDTIVLEDNIHVRLLGINSPEKNEKYYLEAKNFLNELVLNKKIRIEFGKEKKDRYKRTLAYLYYNNENINKALIEKGLANPYFPSGKDIHYKEFNYAWDNCIKNKINLCEFSEEKCANCILLKELNYKTQEVEFYNQCNFNCDLSRWKIKDEGRNNIIFPEFILNSKSNVKIIVGNETNNNEELFWKGKNYIWTKTGDTLFLRDKNGKLILWERY